MNYDEDREVLENTCKKDFFVLEVHVQIAVLHVKVKVQVRLPHVQVYYVYVRYLYGSLLWLALILLMNSVDLSISVSLTSSLASSSSGQLPRSWSVLNCRDWNLSTGVDDDGCCCCRLFQDRCVIGDNLDIQKSIHISLSITVLN